VVGSKKYLRPPSLTLESLALDHIDMATTSSDTAAQVPTVYVDEQIGSDESGDGSIQKPYASAAHAIVIHGACPPLVILTRKKDEEWAPIGISALKKARKGAEGIEKKRKKAQEAEAKAAEKAAEQEKVKSVVLAEDESLPKAVKVRSFPYLGWPTLTSPIGEDQVSGAAQRTTSQGLWMGSQATVSGEDDLRCHSRRDRLLASHSRWKVGSSKTRHPPFIFDI
jgi:hypothetical protein